MSYLEAEVELAALRAMPLDSAYRGVPFDRLVKRLKEERNLAGGGETAGVANALAVVVLIEQAPDDALRATLESMALQSFGPTRCILVAGDTDQAEAARGWLAKLKLAPGNIALGDIEVWVGLEAAQRATLSRQRMVTFLRHGDRLHPSAGTALAKLRGSAAVVAWGELQPSADGSKLQWAQRNPVLDTHALQHWPYLRNAFAVESKWVIQYPGDLAREALRNHLHLFQLWLLQKADVTRGSVQEPLLIRANHRAAEDLAGVARAAFEDYADAYVEIFRQSKAFELKLLPGDSPAPYYLVPRVASAVVSVIIPFRDKPDLTVKAARSALAQNFSGYLEVVLVDNQSTAESLTQLRSALAREFDGGRCKLIAYNKPFNHSAQCNLAVAESLGDVIVFLNNDAIIQSPNAVQEMAAWAAAPGVGSVGVRMVNPADQQETAGMSLRLQPTAYFDSIVEEASDACFTPFVREVFGNTFACAAVSRATFMEAGRLDPVSFPNGYNDVDFACRVNLLGLRSVSLGHLCATHTPGASRGRVDEAPQKTLLRSLYPQMTAMALDELKLDTVLTERAKQLPVTAGTSPLPPRVTPTPPLPSVTEAEQRPLPKRLAQRLAETPFMQRALRNPTIYRLVRSTYKLIVR
ncbi:MAG: glycosyltransferase [Hyphomonadaceae bacterium]|nr:glycosyltransferase [Hyphomonadaceae bacterium]